MNHFFHFCESCCSELVWTNWSISSQLVRKMDCMIQSWNVGNVHNPYWMIHSQICWVESFVVGEKHWHFLLQLVCVKDENYLIPRLNSWIVLKIFVLSVLPSDVVEWTFSFFWIHNEVHFISRLKLKCLWDLLLLCFFKSGGCPYLFLACQIDCR